MSTSYNIATEVEEESSTPYPKETMTYSNEWNTNSKDTMLTIIPHSKMGSNKTTDPPMAFDSVQFVCKWIWGDLWNYYQVQNLLRKELIVIQITVDTYRHKVFWLWCIERQVLCHYNIRGEKQLANNPSDIIVWG